MQGVIGARTAADANASSLFTASLETVNSNAPQEDTTANVLQRTMQERHIAHAAQTLPPKLKRGVAHFVPNPSGMTDAALHAEVINFARQNNIEYTFIAPLVFVLQERRNKTTKKRKHSVLEEGAAKRAPNDDVSFALPPLTPVSWSKKQSEQSETIDFSVDVAHAWYTSLSEYSFADDSSPLSPCLRADDLALSIMTDEIDWDSLMA